MEKKNNPQTMLLGEYNVRTGKTPQHKSTYTINTRLCNRGRKPVPASSHLVPEPLFRRWSQTRLSGWRFKATEARDRGRGGECISLYMCVCVCVCVVVCNQQMSVEWGRKQERLTAVLFPGLTFQQQPWPRPVLVRGAKKR